MKEKKYFILDEKEKAKQVSQEVHAVWREENSKKYNLEFQRADGTKEVILTFHGIKESDKELVLFSVRSIFRSFDGEVVTDFNHNYNNLKEAKEDYDEELFLNGDDE